MLYDTTGLLDAKVFNWMFNVRVCLNSRQDVFQLQQLIVRNIYLKQFFLRVVKITPTEELIEQVRLKKLDLGVCK